MPAYSISCTNGPGGAYRDTVQPDPPLGAGAAGLATSLEKAKRLEEAVDPHVVP